MLGLNYLQVPRHHSPYLGSLHHRCPYHDPAVMLVDYNQRSKTEIQHMISLPSKCKTHGKVKAAEVLWQF